MIFFDRRNQRRPRRTRLEQRHPCNSIVFGSIPFILTRLTSAFWCGRGSIHESSPAYLGFAYDFRSPLRGDHPPRRPFSGTEAHSDHRLTTLRFVFLVWMGVTRYSPFTRPPRGRIPDRSQDSVDDLRDDCRDAIARTAWMLIWVIVLSIGYFGCEGRGIHHQWWRLRVWGPAGTYVEGNNEIALLLMILPLMQFLGMTSQDKWVRGHCWRAWSCGWSIDS
jgi:hypothetical protein